MQMLNLSKIIKNLKKSHSLLIGSLLIFAGIITLSWNYLLKMSEQVYSDMRISMMDVSTSNEVPIEDNLQNINDNNNTENTNVTEVVQPQVQAPKPVDFSKYYGVIEIPRIELKRGFYNTDSKYNTIEKNVTMVQGSTMPDVDKGNLILMAHSGWAAISYFEYLYNLSIGDYAYVTYAGKQYAYKLVSVYDVAKTGKVKVVRNYEKTTLTLITCTRNNDKAQTVYILELV